MATETVNLKVSMNTHIIQMNSPQNHPTHSIYIAEK